MKSKKPHNPVTAPKVTKAPLSGLVDNKLNKPLADVIAEALDKKGENPGRSGARDYAHGTAEHDDEPEA